MTREVLLTGSVPREPAAEVFRIVNGYLAKVLRRVPDGEQKAWGGEFGLNVAEDYPMVEESPRQAPLTTAPGSPFLTFGEEISPVRLVKLRDGVDPSEFAYPRSGVAEIKIDSYRQFRKMKDDGEIPADQRFVATLPSPATTGFLLDMPLEVGVVAVAEMMRGEIREILDAIPHDELAIQVDLAVEVEMEELRRRPDAFRVPVHHEMADAWGEWSSERLAEIVTSVTDIVPEDVELGFHECGLWHIDRAGGQDMQVHVDWANLMVRTSNRRIDYIHMASVPEHGDEDYAALEQLEIGDTSLFLGVIHLRDGLDGAKRRVAAAARHRADFGVAHFCGIQPMLTVQPEQLDELLELHQQVAEL